MCATQRPVGLRRFNSCLDLLAWGSSYVKSGPLTGRNSDSSLTLRVEWDEFLIPISQDITYLRRYNYKLIDSRFLVCFFFSLLGWMPHWAARRKHWVKIWVKLHPVFAT